MQNETQAPAGLGREMWLTIQGSRRLAGAVEDIDFGTKAAYLYQPAESWILYEESALTGMEGTKTAVKLLGGDKLTITRTGTVNNCMAFMPGKWHYTAYKTPYGVGMLRVRTHFVRSSLGPEGGSIELAYDALLERENLGRTELKLSVRDPRVPPEEKGTQICPT